MPTPITRTAGTIGLAVDFINAAKLELADYTTTSNEVSYRQACEKGWAAIAQAVIHVNGRHIYYHRGFEEAASRLTPRTGIDLVSPVAAGNQLHGQGFYQGRLSPSSVGSTLGLIESRVLEVQRRFP